MKVADPWEENVWWDGGDLCMRLAEGQVLVFREAQVTGHEIHPSGDSSAVEEIPVTFETIGAAK